MRIGLIIGFLAITFNNLAQTRLSESEHDFGTMVATTQRFVDISVENPGTEQVYILRIEKGPNITHKLSSDVIPAGGKVTLRVQVNPVKTGKFQTGCNVFLSNQNQPLTLTLSGNVVELDQQTFNTTACPDFNATPPQQQHKELTIVTVDKETREVLSRSKVVIIRNGEPAGAWITGKNGSFKVDMASGYFYFLATHDGYLTKEDGIYVPPDKQFITIPLVKDPVSIAQIPADTATTVEAEVLNPEETKEILSEVIEQTEVKTDTLPVTNPEFAEIDKANFDEKYFTPVNIEFVIDISSSMKQEDKMELMKYALNQLVAELRPVDRMGIVTYADNAKVFQPPISCDRKDVILKAVSELKPQGMTAGGKGIKKGYSELMQNYDPNKTNIVIVITDGAFNKDSDDYQKVVKKYAKKGVIFSVVGVKTNSGDTKRMTEAATFGGGRFIGIEQLSDAQTKLFQEIRTASFIRR